MCQGVAQLLQLFPRRLGLSTGREDSQFANFLMTRNDRDLVRELKTIEQTDSLVSPLPFGQELPRLLQARLRKAAHPRIGRAVSFDQLPKAHFDQRDDSEQPHSDGGLLQV